MNFNDKEVKKWIEDAINKSYTLEELVAILREKGFDNSEINSIMRYYSEDEKKPEKKNENKQKFEPKKLPVNKISSNTAKIPEKPKKKILNLFSADNSKYKGEENEEFNQAIKQSFDELEKVRQEVSKVVFGQEKILNEFLLALLCNAHALVEGIPGIAKTLLIKTLAKISGCSSKRVQFTADLLPTDITGITTYTPEKGFKIVKGPVFSNFMIADEINRSPPKTQSALLEAMQERQVTIGRKRFELPSPFFVMANNNPIETSGVYTLPEAQIDRFLFKLIMSYPKGEHELKIMEENVNIKDFQDYDLKVLLSPEKILYMQELVKKVYLDDRIKNYILHIVTLTRTRDFPKGEYIKWGASPRASIGLFIAAKANAFLHGRAYAIPDDIKAVVYPVLRHRVILNYRANADGISSDDVISEILNKVDVR